MKRIIDAHPYITSAVLAVVLTSVSYLVAIAAGWVVGIPNPIELAAVAISFACTYLCVVQKRFNYVLGVIASALYATLFFQYGLIASAVLNVYLVGTLVYGWFRWRPDRIARPVQHVKLSRFFLIYVPVSVGVYLLALLLVTALGGQLAVVDSLILVGTILAQFLLDNKKLETWFVWAAVNVAAIYVYFSTGLPLAGLQYVFFLGNTVYGYVQWRQSMKKFMHPVFHNARFGGSIMLDYVKKDVELTQSLYAANVAR